MIANTMEEFSQPLGSLKKNRSTSFPLCYDCILCFKIVNKASYLHFFMFLKFLIVICCVVNKCFLSGISNNGHVIGANVFMYLYFIHGLISCYNNLLESSKMCSLTWPIDLFVSVALFETFTLFLTLISKIIVFRFCTIGLDFQLRLVSVDNKMKVSIKVCVGLFLASVCSDALCS